MRIGTETLTMNWQSCLTGITVLFFRSRRFVVSAYMSYPITVERFNLTIEYIKRK